MKRWSYLIVWLVLCFGAGALGAGFGPGEWYARLSKPGWTPPGWLFAPVWTVLYALMAVAAWLVSTQRESRGRRLPVMLFSLQLAANAAWPWLFFGLQRPGLALVDLVLLWLLLSLTVVVFYTTRRTSGLLLLPYWLWVTFATALNAEIWRLNG